MYRVSNEVQATGYKEHGKPVSHAVEVGYSSIGVDEVDLHVTAGHHTPLGGIFEGAMLGVCV